FCRPRRPVEHGGVPPVRLRPSWLVWGNEVLRQNALQGERRMAWDVSIIEVVRVQGRVVGRGVALRTEVIEQVLVDLRGDDRPYLPNGDQDGCCAPTLRVIPERQVAGSPAFLGWAVDIVLLSP